MYTDKNYQTKKQLKADVLAGKQVGVYQPNADVTGFAAKTDGRVSVEGPHYPQPHKWYASVEIKGGIIVKVIS